MKRNPPRLAPVFVALMSLFAIQTVYGQSRPIERAADQIRRALGIDDGLESEAASIEDRREEEDEPTGDTTPLGVNVGSIQLISNQDKATMDPGVGSASVLVDEDLPAPDGLQETLEEYIGKPMSMALLSQIGKDIVLAWRESDYPLVDVYYPEQNITEGRLQLVVREAVLGTKKTEGALISREEYLLSNLRIDPGNRINKNIVAADVDWLNENPIRQVNLIYERGEEDGTSDIVLDVIEEDAISAYVGFANTGVNFTGEEEWSFGFTLSNPGRLEHTLGYNLTTDLESDNLHAHSVFYQAYLPWRHIFQVSAAYVTSEALDKSVTDTNGLSRQLSTVYRIPLTRPKFNPAWRHYLSFAFDYKSTNTDLIFGGVNIFDSDVAVGQFRAFYEFNVPDKQGVTKASIGIVGAPGDMFDDNDDASFDLARLASESSYFYAFGEIERLQRLPAELTLRLKIRGQATENRLGSTEQILAGGYNTVRGFDESIIRGDSGLISNLELISPAFSICGVDKGLNDSWNALVFYDAAVMGISESFPAEGAQSLQSAGLGLNCKFGEHGFARAAYGWEVASHGLLEREDSGKFHFGFTLLY
ncbi:MAG: ShlB/FhaC/HecB family hemolysin secretion/activation protein [Verrucomicrobiales bacterium]|nr:ShlB/FhaC/HecB family hemolysin secretion/activation protein [Verrucomicrobiales bacterium]